mmetsp:Transcript_5532/g.15423  ORF Transcript_5532/g.15423 Transcript_5532/m.15423 type:complete len:236 (-) Transcript_5532:988-1695(-)
MGPSQEAVLRVDSCRTTGIREPGFSRAANLNSRPQLSFRLSPATLWMYRSVMKTTTVALLSMPLRIWSEMSPVMRSSSNQVTTPRVFSRSFICLTLRWFRPSAPQSCVRKAWYLKPSGIHRRPGSSEDTARCSENLDAPKPIAPSSAAAMPSLTGTTCSRLRLRLSSHLSSSNITASVPMTAAVAEEAMMAYLGTPPFDSSSCTPPVGEGVGAALRAGVGAAVGPAAGSPTMGDD